MVGIYCNVLKDIYGEEERLSYIYFSVLKDIYGEEERLSYISEI